MTELWPWLLLIALGAFHGINPAMGWLFAVALGLHRNSLKVVLVSLLPIAAGHALAVAIVVYAVLAFGMLAPQRPLQIALGLLLIFWGLYHALGGHRHRVRVGMTTGMMGLGLWSFLMATSHGAGLMLIPALIPLQDQATQHHHHGDLAFVSVLTSLLAIAVHMAAMLAVTGAVAVIIYRWVGLEFLRRGWINLDVMWTAALVLTGLLLIAI